MRLYLCLILFGVLVFSCQQDSTKKEVKTLGENILPNKPNEVAKQWVEAFYNDNFSKAVKLGTENTRMMIDSVKKEIVANAVNVQFKIYNMNCETVGDSSFCTYIYREVAEDFDEYVSLLKVNGQWLVDESWETE